MSLIPLHLTHDLFHLRPSHYRNELGLNSGDFTSPYLLNAVMPPLYYRPWRSSASADDFGSTVSTTENEYKINLDVQQFQPEEITVKVIGNNVIKVEGKHEEKEDEHGMISRHFVRKYVFPKGYDLDNIVSNLSSDGVLSIVAPKIQVDESEHRTIPIKKTGVPVKISNKDKTQTDRSTQLNN